MTERGQMRQRRATATRSTARWGLRPQSVVSVLLVLGSLSCSASGSDLIEPPPPPPPPPPPTDTTPATIRLEAGTRYQTISGWYATPELGQYTCPTYPLYKDELMDRAVNELGLNRLKMGLPASIEHPHNHFADFMAGNLSFGAWVNTWKTAVNDNADPFVMNPAGFQWGQLDDMIENIVIPMRQRLRSRGEPAPLMGTFGDSQTDPFDHKRAPEEYAEFLLAIYLHMQSKYGFVPDVLEVINEPDTGPVSWSPGQIGAAIVAAGQRLEAAGFTPRFAVPAASGVDLANLIFDAVIRTPGALKYISEISYHRYSGVSDANVQGIGQRAQQYNIGANMSEHIGSGFEDLYTDLTLGRNTAWMQFGLALCGSGVNDGGGIYYRVDQSDPARPVIQPRSRTPFLWQYFRYIRNGAQRIAASTSDANVVPIAFLNANGKYVVVVNAAAQASFTIGDLPAGVYGITFATDSESNGSLPDVSMATGQKLPATIPARGVLTVFGK